MLRIALSILMISAVLSCNKNEAVETTSDPKLENVVSETDSINHSPTIVKDVIEGSWLTESFDTVDFIYSGTTSNNITYPFTYNNPRHHYKFVDDDKFFAEVEDVSLLNTTGCMLLEDTLYFTKWFINTAEYSYKFKVNVTNNNVLVFNYAECMEHPNTFEYEICNTGKFNRNEPNILTRLVD